MEYKADIHPFGVTSQGEAVSAITLSNDTICCTVLTYGATLQSLLVPDRDGTAVDVVLGYDTLKEYEVNGDYLGATVGRFANRIARGAFVLDGEEYTLATNDGANHLHGGKVGFSDRVWSVEHCAQDTVTLTLRSEDGDEGYPGNLEVAVTYTLRGGMMEIDYRANSDAPTPCNLTNHSYFNLAGHNSGKMLDQTMQIFAGHYTPSGKDYIPFGTIDCVEGTAMDLREPTQIGSRVRDAFQQIAQAGGYDHNFVLDGEAGVLHPAAKVYAPKTGIAMQVNTTEPGIQFYSSNMLEEGRVGKGGCAYGQYHGYCLETQHYPDSPNQPEFPSVILRPGELYRHTTQFVFDAK